MNQIIAVGDSRIIGYAGMPGYGEWVIRLDV